jgi:type IV pilus assembly protein PilB
MLVSYGLLTQADLDRALAYQQGTGKRLGQILVELDLVTHAQVAQVLEEQLSRREGRLMWGAGAQLIS